MGTTVNLGWVSSNELAYFTSHLVLVILQSICWMNICCCSRCIREHMGNLFSSEVNAFCQCRNKELL